MKIVSDSVSETAFKPKKMSPSLSQMVYNKFSYLLNVDFFLLEMTNVRKNQRMALQNAINMYP